MYLLIPLSVVAVFAAAWVFLRMSDSGQFEDMDGPAWSVLHDDDRPARAGEPAADEGGGDHRSAPDTRSGDNRNVADNGDTLRIDAAQDRQETTSR
ncbi:cbb3-type cytochrome oxidase assembly protein CcoS [Zeimonas arvi]|uniref:cbb3-type cytochrome oxidase assembly protein CcoS n=1 Tax=Zeimonas arvi TaxID=2498847 RepID=UPI002265D7CC|nr:cbb3-type cytochrome oxidase assembly protein CcoS [Zeimonas arvi]